VALGPAGGGLPGGAAVFVLYPLVVLFGNSVLDESGAYSLAAFIALARDSQFVQAFQNSLLGVVVTACTVMWACPSPTWWRATNFHSRTWWPCCPS
jgi:ABC-type spermidine/putrescine transport system permease subunit II